MAAYRIPSFNLGVNIWRATSDVQAVPADVTAVGNLTNGRSGGGCLVWPITANAAANVANFTLTQQTISLLLPKLTDVRGMEGGANAAGDCIECPAGSGRYYVVLWVDDVGKGFFNEHREAVMIHTTANFLTVFGNPWNALPWPVPYP